MLIFGSRCGGPTHGISVGNLGSSSGSKEGTVKNIVGQCYEFHSCYGLLMSTQWKILNTTAEVSRN